MNTRKILGGAALLAMLCCANTANAQFEGLFQAIRNAANGLQQNANGANSANANTTYIEQGDGENQSAANAKDLIIIPDNPKRQLVATETYKWVTNNKNDGGEMQLKYYDDNVVAINIDTVSNLHTCGVEEWGLQVENVIRVKHYDEDQQQLIEFDITLKKKRATVEQGEGTDTFCGLRGHFGGDYVLKKRKGVD